MTKEDIEAWLKYYNRRMNEAETTAAMWSVYFQNAFMFGQLWNERYAPTSK